jgi:hypothetical protein
MNWSELFNANKQPSYEDIKEGASGFEGFSIQLWGLSLCMILQKTLWRKHSMP